MSRSSVRNGIATYFTGLEIPYVGSVFPARPVILGEDAYTNDMLGRAVAQTAAGSSAVLVVNLVRTERKRIALTGRGAVNDTRIHDVALEIWFASGRGDGIAAQDDYDLITNALENAIRSDPTLGGCCWSAGEEVDGPGVEHRQGEPMTAPDGLTILIASDMSFQAWEMVVGNVADQN